MNHTRLKVPVTESDHHRGPVQASLIMVEYGDFECPHCAMAYPQIEQLTGEFKNELCFVYRHFPLRNLHPHAELAALAAEAADQQGRFWQMHHLLFENYDSLSDETILALAATLALDLERFNEDLDREDLRKRVHQDFIGGINSGVNGTPTIFFNDLRFDSPVTYANLKYEVERRLGQSSSSVFV